MLSAHLQAGLLVVHVGVLLADDVVHRPQSKVQRCGRLHCMCRQVLLGAQVWQRQVCCQPWLWSRCITVRWFCCWVLVSPDLGRRLEQLACRSTKQR